MVRLGLACILGIFISFGATADDYEFPVNAVSYWSHNGSMVFLTAKGRHRRFYYYAPREAMINAGASQGMLLFDGLTTGHSYSGTAYLFKGPCGKTGYKVSGPILNDNKRVVMHGRAPKMDADCTIHGYFNDELVFDFLRYNDD